MNQKKKINPQFLLGIVLCIITFSSCSSLNKQVGLRDDNLIEEGIETYIETKTGLDIDLTPNTREEQNEN